MSSGNGDGGGFFDDLAAPLESFSGGGNFFENLANDYASLVVQGATGGFLSYKDGKIGNGVSTNILKKTGQAIVSGTKEVTGAKAAEAANDMARKQFEEAKAQAETDRKNSEAQVARDQMKQSQTAAGARASATTRSSTGGTSGGSLSLGEDEKDFLGL